MAISFRGTASRLKQMTEKRNPAGFQEKSAAGPRDGVGGEKVTVEQAAKRFAKRIANIIPSGNAGLSTRIIIVITPIKTP